MKKITFKLLAMLFVAVLGIGLLSSCKDDDEDELVGTWVATGNQSMYDYSSSITTYLTFNKNGTGTTLIVDNWTDFNGKLHTDTDYESFTYTVNGNQLTTFRIEDDGDLEARTGIFSINNGVLTISEFDEDWSITWVFIKQ